MPRMNARNLKVLLSCAAIGAMFVPFVASAQTKAGGDAPSAPPTPPAAPATPAPASTPSAPAQVAADSRVPPRFSAPGTRDVKFPTGLYDEKMSGALLLAEGIAQAKAEGKRVLVTWGENQCGFCVYLSDMLWYESAGCRALLDTEYVLVKLDVSKQFTKNNDLAQKYGATASHQMEDAPRLTVIDPVLDRGVGTLSGKVMLAKPMTMEKVFDEAVVMDFLEQNRAPVPAAIDVLNGAMKDAIFREENVLVFFTSSNASCVECAQWKAWLAKPEVKTALDKAFALATVDSDRMTGGQSFLEKFADKRPILAPAISVVTDRGVRLDPPVTLTKFPATAEEASAAVELLARAAGKKMTDEMKETLRSSFGISGGNAPKGK